MSRNEVKRGPKSKRSEQRYPFSSYQGAQWLLSLLIGAAIEGYALRVGLTRDGGALAIGVYMGDEYGTEYIRPDEDLAVALREIGLAWGLPLATWDDTAGCWILVP